MAIDANNPADRAGTRGQMLARSHGEEGPARHPAARPIAPGLTDRSGEDATAAPDAAALMKAMRRCWAAGSGLGLIASLVAGLATWALMPSPKFVATATLQAASAPPKILATIDADRADFGTYLRTQVAMIKSRAVLNRFLFRPEIAGLGLLRDLGDPLEWLEKEIQVESRGSNELLKVSLKGECPGDLARIVNGLSDSYLQELRAQETRERSDRLRQLTENYGRYVGDRTKRRGELKDFSDRVGSHDRRAISVKQEIDLERLEVTRRELLYLQSDLRKAQVELAVIEAGSRGGPPGEAAARAVAEAVASDPIASSHGQRIAHLEGKLGAARRIARDEDDPPIRMARHELESARQAHATRRGEVMKAAVGRIGDRAAQEVAGRVTSARERVAILEEHERILSAEVDRLAEESRALNSKSVALEESLGDMDRAEVMVRRIASEIEAQRVELMAPSRVRMLEQAEVPTRRDSRPRLKATFATAGGAFAISLLALTWRESQAGRIDSTQAVKRLLGLKLLGVLPRLEDKLRRQVCRPQSPLAVPRASLYFESIDATRAMLLRVLEEKPTGVVLVTSALKAEGKTSLSCHLAASLARAGRSTLLIDGDLRIPSAHKLFGLPNEVGLSEVLRGETATVDAIRPTTHQGLMFLPAGECDAAALDFLSRGKAGEIIAECRRRFEIILIDSSPILPVADPIQLGRHCDGVVFSILEDVSTVPAIRAAFDRLGSIDVPVLGAVVAGSSMVSYKYQFYRKPSRDTPRGRIPPPAGALPPAARAPRPISRQPGRGHPLRPLADPQ